MLKKLAKKLGLRFATSLKYLDMHGHVIKIGGAVLVLAPSYVIGTEIIGPIVTK